LGLNVRVGRFVSIPDIEAQLAPNNYTYVHSLTYTYDNFTNTGVLGTLAVTKNWIVQLDVVAGTETMPWNKRSPGTAAVRWTSVAAATTSISSPIQSKRSMGLQ
jgi:hypothetical protein